MVVPPKLTLLTCNNNDDNDNDADGNDNDDDADDDDNDANGDDVCFGNDVMTTTTFTLFGT